MLHLVVPRRDYSSYAIQYPSKPGQSPDYHFEQVGEKIIWLKIRQMTDIPNRGKELFQGSKSEKDNLYRLFRNYARQGLTYWEAGKRTNGSAAALPYYYSALNLAKAELLRTNPKELQNPNLNHGLSMKSGSSQSIKGDSLEVKAGVFRYLFKKRTGLDIPVGTRLPIMNLLSLIPEIGLEVSEIGANRPPSGFGYHVVATDTTSAFTFIAVDEGLLADQREPLARIFNREFERISTKGWSEWKQTFALSGRLPGSSIAVYQSKKVFPIDLANETLTSGYSAASRHLWSNLKSHLSEPIGYSADFLLTHTLQKSKQLVIPLDLARYAVMYYLSSLVRYKPSKLDPVYQGAQAWLMDSLAREVPLNILASALMGIRTRPSYFEAREFRI